MPVSSHSKAAAFSLDPASGGFRDRTGLPIAPVGVNYWPSSTGVEMWREWPEAEIRRDFDLKRSLRLNCERFFLRWEDFEPRPGAYDRRSFRRLADLLRWHRECGLRAIPSLFVGWRSGGIFWPEWRRGRNIFAHPAMRDRASRFARRGSEVLARLPETVLAVDHGNELCCLPDCATAAPAQVARWCGSISRAIGRSFPRALVISDNEQNQVNADTGWRFGGQPGCDLYSMHTYPVGAWHSLAFDGMAHFALLSLELNPAGARAGRLPPAGPDRTLVLAGARLTLGETAAPAEWVRGGGRLVWHGPDILTWGSAMSELPGAEPVDFCAPRVRGVRAFGRSWDFDCFPRGIFPRVRPTAVRVAAKSADGKPLVLCRKFGAGAVAARLAEPDMQFARRSDNREARRALGSWHAGMLKLTRPRAGSR